MLVAAARNAHVHHADVTDAWIAAAVLHLGEQLVTFDRGCRRLFPPEQLTVRSPTTA